MEIGLGNRDNLNEATPMGGRAERAAKNSIEAAVFFVPLALVANAAGLDARCCRVRKLPLGSHRLRADLHSRDQVSKEPGVDNWRDRVE